MRSMFFFKLWSNNIDLLFHEDFVSVKDLQIIVYTSWGEQCVSKIISKYVFLYLYFVIICKSFVKYLNIWPRRTRFAHNLPVLGLAHSYNNISSNDQLSTKSRLYHYHWSLVVPGLFRLSDAANDVQFYWAVWLQWWRVCWSGRCCRVSIYSSCMVSKCYSQILKTIK